jgi:FMN phosphatase YigB (HAD superfamily)
VTQILGFKELRYELFFANKSTQKRLKKARYRRRCPEFLVLAEYLRISVCWSVRFFVGMSDKLCNRTNGICVVGDSLRCDILGAKSVGFSTAWINPSASSHPAADIVVSGFIEFE